MQNAPNDHSNEPANGLANGQLPLHADISPNGQLPDPTATQMQMPALPVPKEQLLSPPGAFTQGGVPLSHQDYCSASRSAPKAAKHPRLGRPVVMMRPEYDVVVVGTGYGGGVAASRFARAGKSVGILELGKERWPGEFPTSIREAVPELHVSGNAGRNEGPVIDAASGGPTGMYHLVLGEGQNALVANGVGGTSLINANVFLRADKRTLAMENWPAEIRENPDCLDPYFERAEEVLQPMQYPEGYPKLNKLSALEQQAELLGQRQNFYRVPQTTFFRNGLNSTGVEMRASTGAGQDCTGVNDGSKNSVLMNYIPDAWNWGAELFCECEVRYVAKDPRGKGWIVFYAWHGDGRSKFKDTFHKELMWVRAKEVCCLAAGALATTEILLRSRVHGLSMSRAVGRGMSGNGDILSFGYNTDKIINSMGREKPPADYPPGPTITGVIDNRGEATSPNVLDGYVIEEGCCPEALAPLLQAMLEAMPGKKKPEPYSVSARLRHLLTRTETRFFGPYAPGSSVNRTQIYLIMSHDNNEATLTLEDDKAYLRFLGVGRSEHVKTLNEVLRRATNAIGGTLVNSPFYAVMGEEQITVHPIGGANMSCDGTGRGGGTNHLGELFAGEGSHVHEGLMCTDGAIIPTALGVNPFATITALAERCVDGVARKKGWNIDMHTRNGRLDLFGKPRVEWPMTPDMIEAQRAIAEAAGSNGMRFSEIMDGHIYIGDDIEDFVVAENKAKGASSAARFYLSVDTYSMKNLVKRSDHASMATGTFSCGALSKDPFLVLRGEVQFFSQDAHVSDGTNLAYKLVLLGTDGQIVHFNGYKTVDSKMAFSARTTWKATTTLFVTLTRPDGTMLGRGRLYIGWRNFLGELRGFGPTGSGLVGRAVALTQFVSYFALQTAGYYFSPLRMLQYPQLTTNGYFPKVPPAETITLHAVDGVETTLVKWDAQPPAGPLPGVLPGQLKAITEGAAAGAPKPPVLLVVGAAVDHQIFALPTIAKNTVEFLTEAGYTVYCSTPRYGRTVAAQHGYTVYDARLDVKAAMEHVRRAHTEPMYVVAHCQGSCATAMGLLDGTLPAAWMRGLTASQFFTNPKFTDLNMLKARTNILTNAYKLVAGNWFSCLSSPDDPLVQKALDQALRFYPVGSTAELCNSACCHRTALVFGRLWEHAQLNAATHANLGNFFGGVHMAMLGHLMRMGTATYVMDNGGSSLITSSNLARLKGLPILFVSGARNAVYSPESTELSYNLLRDQFGPDNYQRQVFAGYGHLDCWMGKQAKNTVYPRVLDHIEWCERRADASQRLPGTPAMAAAPARTGGQPAAASKNPAAAGVGGSMLGDGMFDGNPLAAHAPQARAAAAGNGRHNAGQGRKALGS